MIQSNETKDLEAIVREQIEQWREGAEPDAAHVLAEHPELRGAKSLVMELVGTEYAFRVAAGEAVGKGEFCDRFPAYRQSIAKMLQVHQYLDRCPAFAVEPESKRWPVLGEDFLGYELVEPLGRGGLARVFLARELDLGGRLVVVKISPHGSWEANALGRLSHPSIVPIHSVQHDEAGEWTAICMPLVGVATGIDLLDAAFGATAERNGALMARVAAETKPLTPVPPVGLVAEDFAWDLPYGEAIARLGAQLAEALVAAHAAGIMHRDIKPSNILLAWSGRSMLLDFNLSTDASASSQGIGGTLAYMAPELIACVLNDEGEEARKFDRRCDIYSLGAVLYELLTNRLPARPENADELPLDAYQPWLECKQRAPQAIENAEADARLAAIVLKCLEFDPAARYATAEELAEELHGYLESVARPEPVVELPTLQPQVMPRRSRRSLVLAGIVATGLVVVGLAGSFGVGSYFSKQKESIQLELLYSQGLEEYENKKYDEAVVTFTKCLERKSGWPDALFGRAQALRQLEKWREARTDFTALRDFDAAWSYALAGYCNMRLPDLWNAVFDFRAAHKAGLRDIDFLMNFASVQCQLRLRAEAVQVYSDVLSIDPQNGIAIRNRGMEYCFMAMNTKVPPHRQAFFDARDDCRLNPNSADAAFCAAVIFGEAARKDPGYEKDAVAFLTTAFNQGIPISLVDRYKPQLLALVPLVDQDVVARAAQNPENYVFRLNRAHHEPSNTSNWKTFQKEAGTRQPLIGSKSVAAVARL